MKSSFRLVYYSAIVIFISITFMFCNSSDSKKANESETTCNTYNYYYDELKKITDNINLSSITDMSDQETIDKINTKVSELNKINCPQKKDLKFADNMISQIKQKLADKERQYNLDRLNGDDIGMEGVTISSPEILFYENMDSYVKVTVSNQTKKKLKSLKFGVNYCSPKYYSPLCYKFVVVPITIEPMSSNSFSFDLPSTMPDQTDHPKIKLLEIVRSDGTKVKTMDGIRFSVNPSNDIN